MNQDECWTEVCRRMAHLERQVESLSNRLEALGGRVRVLQVIVIGGMILDFVVKSSKAAAFFIGR